MKLGEIKGERSFEVLANLTTPIIRIAKDKSVRELFEKKTIKKGEDPTEVFLSRMETGLPALITSHARDFAEIMAIINDQSTDEYIEGVTPIQLFADVMELMTDEELLAFLA